MKNVLHLSLVSAILVASVSFLYLETDADVHTDVFCAYGKLFVRFKHQNSVWGTLMLDNQGAPVPCAADNSVKEETKFKGII